MVRIMRLEEHSLTCEAKMSRREFMDLATGASVLAAATGLAGYGIGRALMGGGGRPALGEGPSLLGSPEGSPFTYPDPSTREGHSLYAAICDEFIATRPPNPLGITGAMLADAARSAHRAHGAVVPPELALAQLAGEGGIGNPDPGIRPIRTRNPFNVGNVDTGRNRKFRRVEDAIGAYYTSIARSYLKDKEPEDLVKQGGFVNSSGYRYASHPTYEREIMKIARSANRIAREVLENR